MTRIKICGLSRPCDIDYVNEAMPDYCGFIIDVPRSRRNVSPDQARALRRALRPEILPVGVFVNADPALIVTLVEDGTLALVQLHGQETPDYVKALQRQIHVPVIQAFHVAAPADIRMAEASPAEHILLDNGSGGTGQRFDWSLLETAARPYILAGGLHPGNLREAAQSLRPWGVDLSSGVETDGLKDREKILAAVAALRDIDA